MSAQKPRPFAQTIATILRSRIASLEYKNRFPTENELIREFEASRYAVRSALEKLVADGLIERTAGRGTVVINPGVDNTHWVIRTVGDLINRNLSTDIELVSAAPVASSRYPEIAKRFGLGPGSKLFLIERLARAGAAPHFHSLTFMRLEVGLGVRREARDGRPIILLIEENRRIKAHRVRQEAFAQQAGTRIANRLGLAVGDWTITLERSYFESSGELIVHGELHYPIERFREVTELLRDSAQSNGGDTG